MRKKAEKFVDLFIRSIKEKNTVEPSDRPRRKRGAARLQQRSKSVPNQAGVRYDSDNEDEELFEVVKDTAWDGIKYLGSDNRSTRTMWMFVITAFVVLSMLQIWFQVKQYMADPVSTNIDVEYPAKVIFPAIAICNNNKYRLSYLTKHHAELKNQPRMTSTNPKSVSAKSRNPFDQVIAHYADQPAMDFLKNASHQIEDLVMRCILPNGTECDSSHFVPFQTINGLCWGFNTDRFNPLEVPGSGSEYGLRLLLNMEGYERIGSNHKYFRTHSLPGVQILIFNQTDPPHMSSNGINIPPGFTSYLPITMQQLSKLPRSGCEVESDESKIAYAEDFFSPSNIRSCKYRKYLGRVELKCNCSMRGFFKDYLQESYRPRNTTKPCTVDDWFSCVRPVLKQVTESGAANKCLPPCESFEYSAWQDLNRIPKGLLPTRKGDEITEEELRRLRRSSLEADSEEFMRVTTTTTSTAKPDDQDYVELDDDDDDTTTQHKFVQITELLSEEQAERIRNQASYAFEAQHKFQEDIAARYHKLVKNVRNSKLRLFAAKWGWDTKHFQGIYQRITEKHACIKNITNDYKDIVMYLVLPANRAEEKRAELLLSIVDFDTWKKTPHKYKSLAEVRNAYGDKIEPRRQEIIHVIRMSKDMWNAFNEVSYTPTIVADLSEMDRIIDFAEKLEHRDSGLEQWAEDMTSADRQFFVNEEFHEAWYKTIFNDLDKTLVKTIRRVFATSWPKYLDFQKKGDSYLRSAATVFFASQPTKENITRVGNFFSEMEQCMKDVNETAIDLHTEFKTLYKKFKHSYEALFKHELGKLLEKFEFGEQFEKDNFAMVNIYINKMVVEKWSQEETYSFWSLASDIGGSLGLFLGASLVSIIEIIYIFFHFGVSKKVTKKVEEHRERKKSRMPVGNQIPTFHLEPAPSNSSPV